MEQVEENKPIEELVCPYCHTIQTESILSALVPLMQTRGLAAIDPPSWVKLLSEKTQKKLQEKLNDKSMELILKDVGDKKIISEEIKAVIAEDIKDGILQDIMFPYLLSKFFHLKEFVHNYWIECKCTNPSCNRTFQFNPYLGQIRLCQ